MWRNGQVAEWLMAADCKSAAPCELRRFESSPVHQRVGPALVWSSVRDRKVAGLPRAGGRFAVVAQLVERVLGKDEVIGSIPINGSIFLLSRAD